MPQRILSALTHSAAYKTRGTQFLPLDSCQLSQRPSPRLVARPPLSWPEPHSTICQWKLQCPPGLFIQDHWWLLDSLGAEHAALVKITSSTAGSAHNPCSGIFPRTLARRHWPPTKVILWRGEGTMKTSSKSCEMLKSTVCSQTLWELMDAAT